MAVWCPNCHAMLPEGLEACSRCGESLAAAKPQSEEQISRSAIVWYSAYPIGRVKQLNLCNPSTNQ